MEQSYSDCRSILANASGANDSKIGMGEDNRYQACKNHRNLLKFHIQAGDLTKSVNINMEVTQWAVSDDVYD